MNKDILKVLNDMGIAGLDQNANEIMHTTNTNKGEELVPDNVLAKEIFDSIPEYSTFLGSLPGNHGSGLNKVELKAVIGDAGFMKLGAEKTTGALNLSQGDTTVPTDEVTITQKKLEMTIDVSEELSTFNVDDAAGLERRLKEKIGKAASRTIEAAIINGDTITAATGNINSDDGAPTSTDYYLGYLGLRKDSLVTEANGINVGTAEVADLLSMMNVLGDYFSAPEECLWLFNRQTYNKYLGIDSFADADKRGQDSTISGKAITSLYGADVFIARDLKKTEADGKISTATPANNTKGQMLLLWKPSIQYGFGKELQLKLYDRGADGYQLQGWLFFGFAIYNESATRVDPTNVVGYNITV